MFRRCLSILLHPSPVPYRQTLVTMATPVKLPEQTSSPQTPSPTHAPQYYRRVLPPSCISFSSTEGKQVFREALQAGYMEGYFGLAAQFRTQDAPAYCGLSTLVMVLNTLEVDPKRVWKGPWRWYHETMLDCCVPLETASKTGITLDEFACVAACNTLSVNMVRANDEASEEQFRDVVKKLTRVDDEVLVLSYSRGVLDQTGDGHFSPVGGYHPDRDLVLVLDTARFKYPPHWVSLPLIFKAMKACDKDTGLPRGYTRLRRSDTVPLVLFRWDSTLSLPMLDMKEPRETGITRFIQAWDSWLLQPSFNVEGNILEASIKVLVETLGLLGDGEAILTTQVDIRCPDMISTEHSCIVSELLQGLESTPLFKIVKEYLEQNPEKCQKAFNVQPNQTGLRKLCKKSQQFDNQSAEEAAVSGAGYRGCGCEMIITSAHFITVMLMSWPSLKCGNSVCNELRRAVQSQLCCAKPVLQDEVNQLSRQLGMLMKYQQKCMDCHCAKVS